MNGIVNWLGNQIATPSTHLALAIIAQGISAAGLIPSPWGLVATSVFAALGIVVPEAGETIGSAMQSIGASNKNLTRSLAFLLLVGVGVGAGLQACSTTPVTPSQVAQICSAAQPLLTSANAKIAPNPNTSSGSLLTYANSACTVGGQVASTLSTSAQADPTTPSWLEGVLTALQVAGELAPVVLPAL